MRNKLITITSVFVLLAALIAVTTYAFERGLPSNAAASDEASKRTLSINGSGQISLTPDIAYITVGVRTTDEDAKTAVAANNSQTESLIAVLKSLGIAEKDIKTSNFSIYQMEDYNRPMLENNTYPKVFVVENSVNLTVRDLNSLGDLLSAAVDAGANNIYGISFDKEDKTEAYKLTRELAVQNAKEQAGELARLAGVTLGDIQSISAYSYAPIVYAETAAGGAPAMDMAKAVPVSPGQLTISMDVSMVFEIK